MLLTILPLDTTINQMSNIYNEETSYESLKVKETIEMYSIND